MTIKLKQTNTQAYPEPPEWWIGSRPEWAVYWALISLGKKPDIDFSYQSAQLGGRLSKGGAVIDFLMYDPPNLAINVQSTFYHYRTFAQQTKGQLQRVQLEGYGLTVIYIDEQDALSNPRYFVQEALMGNDYSLMAGK